MAERKETDGEIRQDDAGEPKSNGARDRVRETIDGAAGFIREKAVPFVRDTVASAVKKGAESAVTVVGAAADSATESFGAAREAAKGYFARKAARAEEDPEGSNVFVDLSSAVLKYHGFLTKEAGFQKEEAGQAVHDRVDDILKNAPKKGGWLS